MPIKLRNNLILSLDASTWKLPFYVCLLESDQECKDIFSHQCLLKVATTCERLIKKIMGGSGMKTLNVNGGLK